MITFVGTKTSPERYDIGSPVGAGGQNVRAEVMLVQYLLRMIGLAITNPVQPQRPGSFMLIKVDGIVGPKTLDAIHAYQSFNDLQADRRVDPGKKTIRLLNFDFRNHRKSLDFTTPASWPEVPDDLAIALDNAVRAKEEKPRPSRVIARR
jgi:peptidoglycan hydrolase-like protein with peptidoglycan-binding domain